METRQSAANCECIKLKAADGYPIASMRFNSSGRLKGHLIVAGATGVPQGFYRRFAEFASSQGFTTLTFDYRGIGKSSPPYLKGFEASFLDWAHLDLAAVVNEMASDGIPLFIVGHSFGGHALGLLPNHHLVTRFYTFATGAGWHGWMPFFESLRVRMMWNVIMPILTKWKGYLPASMLHLGEDLPIGVYRQWRRWCRFPHYFFDDPTMPHIAEEYAQVRTPIAAANALDDLWSPPRSRDAFVQAYRNAPIKRIDLDPKPFSGGIGHMGYFRQKALTLWDSVLEWFNQPLRTNNLIDPGKPYEH